MVKTLVLTIIALLTLSTVFYAGVQAEDTQIVPGVPEFVLETHAGANGTIIMLIIENQPFEAGASNSDRLVYNVRIRSEGGNWMDLYSAEDWYPPQSNESTTMLTYTAGEDAYSEEQTGQGHPAIPTSGEVEFEVQAMIGHRDRGDFHEGILPYVFVGVTSEWSPAQSITVDIIPPATATSTATPTPPSGKPDALSWIIIVLLIVIVVALLVAAIKIGHKSNKKIVAG